MAKTTPVACTLTPAELAAQAERWHRLIAQAMTERAETSDGLRICFRPEAEEELRALVTAETECCPWATWTVEPDAGTIVLDVRSTAEGVPTLHGMFGPASAW
jgi:MerR family transcriptional regulator, copper efflux regulator